MSFTNQRDANVAAKIAWDNIIVQLRLLANTMERHNGVITTDDLQQQIAIIDTQINAMLSPKFSDMVGSRTQDLIDGENEKLANKPLKRDLRNKNNAKRITESQLRAIIKESVRKALKEDTLNELDWKTYANAARKAHYKGDQDRSAKFG